jgi:hypothetical protein
LEVPCVNRFTSLRDEEASRNDNKGTSSTTHTTQNHLAEGGARLKGNHAFLATFDYGEFMAFLATAARDYLVGGKTLAIPEIMKQAATRLSHTANAMAVFVDARCNLVPGAQTAKSVVLSAYAAFIHEQRMNHGRLPVHKQMEALRKLGVQEKRTSKMRALVGIELQSLPEKNLA